MQLFQINNKDKSKHSKNSKYKQIFVKECLRRLNVKVALNACAKKAVSIRQEPAWQLHSRMRQACSSRLHARNCFQTRGPEKATPKTGPRDDIFGVVFTSTLKC